MPPFVLNNAFCHVWKDATAGTGWFDLPAPPAADLPCLAREVDAMRLRNALDFKRFYRKAHTKAGPFAETLCHWSYYDVFDSFWWSWSRRFASIRQEAHYCRRTDG